MPFEYEWLICSWPHRKGPQTGPRGFSPGCSQAGEVVRGANRRRISAYRLNRRHTCVRSWGGFTTLFILLLASPAARAAEGPFLITYTHQMEEPGSLEVGTKSILAKPNDGNRFLGVATELEYGITDWWMSGVYFDGQTTGGQGTLFTGYRWENRIRLLRHDHWINPILYVEFEDIDSADKTLLEVVNRNGNNTLTEPNGEAHNQKKREIEAKLISDSYFKGWTIAENIIAEKNVAHEPFEFGYAVGVSRPLVLAAKTHRCNFCAENLQLGVEMYGGLGSYTDFGLRGTSHYVAPTAMWTLANGATFRLSPGLGVTHPSTPFMLRFGLSYEIDEFGRAVSSLFHRDRDHL